MRGPLGSAASSSPTLPYGVRLDSAGYSVAASVPGINFTAGSADRTCSAPSANLTSATAAVLATGLPSLLCLNGVGGGVVSSAWQANLSNYTTYRNGTSTLTGCAPLPNQSGCAFFASNRYTANLSEWVDGAPTNSSTIWDPNQTGYTPTEMVFYVLLSFNSSTVLGGLYTVTVALTNATPAPVTFYVRTDPTGWSGSANVTIAFDTTAAWMTLVPSLGENRTLAAEVVPSVTAFHVSASLLPCSLCSVTFTESGLPSGTEWWVNGTILGSQGSTSLTVTFSEPNGTYTYGVASANKSYSAAGGTFTVNGTAVPRLVLFALVPYTVTFSQSGLPSATEWWVNITGASSLSSTGPSVATLLPNGTYAFSAATLNKSYSSQGGGFILKGAPLPVIVAFSPVTYLMVFTERGLSAGTNWSVVVGGVTHSSTGTEITLSEPNASYAYTVGSVSGYGVNRSSGTVRVNGADVVEPLTFTSTPKEATFLGLPATGGYRVLAGAVAVTIVAVLGVVLWVRRRRGKAEEVPPAAPDRRGTPPGNS